MLVTLSSHSQTDYSRALRARAPHVSLLQEANKALRAIERVVRRSELERLAQIGAPAAAHTGGRAAMLERTRARAKAGRGPTPLNEVASKEIVLTQTKFDGYYQTSILEVTALHGDGSTVAGFPVVLKAVAAELTHKSDAGAVALDLAGADDIRSAYARITANLARHGFAGTLDGMLVCQQVQGGLELVLGLNRDPEVGLVAMAGSGVLLNSSRTRLCVPPISREKAIDARTHAPRGSCAAIAAAWC
jgi:acyl-CoA synthetase (NDP forming)